MAGVNHTENGEKIVFLTESIDIEFVALPHSCNIFIRKAHLLCGLQGVKVSGVGFKGALHINNVFNCFEEEGCDSSDFVNLVNRCSTVEQFCDGEDVVITEIFDIG